MVVMVGGAGCGGRGDDGGDGGGGALGLRYDLISWLASCRATHVQTGGADPAPQRALCFATATAHTTASERG